MAQVCPRLLAVRGMEGLHLMHGPPDYAEYPHFKRDPSSTCRVMAFSGDGSLFAWSNGGEVNCVELPSCSARFRMAHPRIACLQFSPSAAFLAGWEPYTVNRETGQASPNLHVWNTRDGHCVRSMWQKKQQHWCPQWSDDEQLCARAVNNEVHFFENGDLGTPVKKMTAFKVADFSLAPGPPPYHVVMYAPGSKGQPSFVRMYKYPQLEGHAAAVANKSFFKADKVDFFWNSAGTALLFLTSTEVDRSGASYYGEQALHFAGTDGNTAIVKMLKDGPIYAVQWNPNPSRREFCVVYGYMPAKATLFSAPACDPLFDFGTGPRNLVHYNPQGSMLVLAGFGNLRGNVEVWDTRSRKQVTKFQAQDTTHLAWCPDGKHILTSTTSPRLRVGNGYRVWHCTGSLLFEVCLDTDCELWEVLWQPAPPGAYPETNAVITEAPPSIRSVQPEASKQAYRPPAARGQPSTFKLRDEEPPSNLKQQESNKPSKNKRKKEARKARKEKEDGQEEQHEKEEVPPSKPAVADTSLFTGDPEKDKKIRGILKKLEQIAKLKEQMEAGKSLEVNQVEKIKREEALLKELQDLQI